MPSLHDLAYFSLMWLGGGGGGGGVAATACGAILIKCSLTIHSRCITLSVNSVYLKLRYTEFTDKVCMHLMSLALFSGAWVLWSPGIVMNPRIVKTPHVSFTAKKAQIIF